MKKKIFIVIVAIIVFLIIINLNDKTMYSKEDKKNYEYSFFNPAIGIINYEDKMLCMNSIYYIAILNYEEYLNYKNNYIDIIEMNRDDFDNYFLLLTVTENESTKNLGLEEIFADEKNLNIGLNKKSIESEPYLNRGLSIKINKNLYRDNIIVFKTIENIGFMEQYKDIKSIEKDYSEDKAQNDNCFIISSIPAKNEEVFIKFLDGVDNKKNSEIRIFNIKLNKYPIIYDIKYNAYEEKYYVCIDRTRELLLNEDGEITNLNTYNYYEYDILKKEIHNNLVSYKLINIKYPENDFEFNYYVK